MMISDLNYLQSAEAFVTGGSKSVKIKATIKIAKVKQDADAETYVKVGKVKDDLKASSYAENYVEIYQ